MDVHQVDWRSQQGADIARQKLGEYISKQEAKARDAVARVFNEVPDDMILPAHAVQYVAGTLTLYEGQVLMDLPAETRRPFLTLHNNAMRQIAGKLEMPAAFAQELIDAGPWGAELVADNFNRITRNRLEPGTRLLVRSVGEQARAVLSDRYRRLDSRPVLDALMGAAKDNGALLVDGYSGDVKVCAKFIVPRILEPVPGEFMVFGVSWSNSDYGCGANELDSFFVRLMCLNGAIAAVEMRKIHLGARLQDGIQYSDETYRLDTEALASAVKDSARFLLSEGRVDSLSEAIRKANAEPADGKALVERFKRAFTKKESERLAEIYTSADVVNLPAGNSNWRFSNAVSYLAHEVGDVDGQRALDMQKWAGDLVAA